ncbi:MAG: hypothetical protein DMG04_08520 [Acidobacteria bacterium]|nr:MAG: hypothetical protein DMG04_08520 [Acidobacteriota bacterium]PYR05203.1 MAG: hypothetical protein DMF99_29360 [Acidobacteriota bacterium]
MRFCLRILCVACAAATSAASPARAHDLERTQVSLTFARDGSFVLDVSNDPSWLTLRMEPFLRGPQRAAPGERAVPQEAAAPRQAFIDRVVLWVDGREVRPESAELLPPRIENGLATYRLRGHMPLDARTLRWYYGLVVDPYPLTIRRADRRIVVEEIAGDAWSRSIDLSAQFASPLRLRLERQLPTASLFALFALGLSLRRFSRRRDRSAQLLPHV